jgi:hypothetical protein
MMTFHFTRKQFSKKTKISSYKSRISAFFLSGLDFDGTDIYNQLDDLSTEDAHSPEEQNHKE